MGILQLPMFAVRLSGAEGDDAVEAPVSRAGVEQQHCLIVQAGYMRMAAADNINAAAQTFIQQSVVVIMSGKLMTVANKEAHAFQHCFNQTLTGGSTVHITCYTQDSRAGRKLDVLKILHPVTAVNQGIKWFFTVNDFLQPLSVSMAVGYNKNFHAPALS
jgi:hypothetical protein